MTKAPKTDVSNDNGNNKKLEFKSPAEFFANNKNIAGFDNPGKSLYTTIREFVENSLDASESIGVLPELQIRLEELNEEDLFKLRGGVSLSQKRVNVSLYRDYVDPSKPEKKRKISAPKKGVKSSQAESVASGSGILDNPEQNDEAELLNPPVDETDSKKKEDKKKNQNVFYRVTVRDNGCGMSHDDVPNMFGRVLAGTKYGVKQARGKFGLGAKMALIWSKCSTGCPIEIKTSQRKNGTVTYCRLDIDIYKNEPKILEHKRLPNTDEFRGSEISVIIEGNYSSYKAKILSYLRQMAIITPYAHIEYHFKSLIESKSVSILYARRSNTMPPNAKEVKYHPSSVNLLLVKKILLEAEAKKLNFLKFLTECFSNVDSKLANQIIQELGDGFSPEMKVSELTENKLLNLTQLFKQMKFPPPDGDCLSPAGEYNLRLGIMKELNPHLIATYQEKCRVFEGHPFIVEAAVSLGGKSVSPGLNIYRFANRIPLLFEAGGDVVTRTASTKINWANYKIRQQIDKIGVFVSIVCTKIPFKGTGKEYIGDDIEEIAQSVKHAIQQCCLQLKSKLNKEAELKIRQERKQNLTRYIPTVAKSIFTVLQSASVDGIVKANITIPEENIILTREKVAQLLGRLQKPNAQGKGKASASSSSANSISLKDISERLVQHVEAEDAQQALDYVRESNLKKAPKVKAIIASLPFINMENVAGLCLQEGLINVIFNEKCLVE